MTRLERVAANPDFPAEQRAAAGFAFAKTLDDAGRYDDAFAAYERANELYRMQRAAAGDSFDASALVKRVDGLIAEFSPAFFDRIAGWGNPSEVPVFVVGMPRSGTSLVEQIAATHSCVVGAGELRNIGEAASELGESITWSEDRVRRVADLQLQRLTALGNGAERMIDKLPDNIFVLGVIAALYPKARVIFCRRDPRDIGLSCFFQMFSAGQLTFSYNLADCGARIRETERLAAHWHRVLPLRYLDIHYESLVANLEEESRRLIAFLGLSWDPVCLEFHRKLRTVQTASSWQVRQPIYDTSIRRWHHYERHLKPLIQGLGSAVE